MSFDKLQNFAGGAIVSLLSVLIGGWDLPLRVLLILIALDILSGLAKGWKECNFSSRQFREGLLTKATFFLVIILAYQIDLVLGNAEPLVRTITVTYYCVVEATSLLENAAVLGIPIPSFIVERLAALNPDKNQKTK